MLRFLSRLLAWLLPAFLITLSVRGAAYAQEAAGITISTAYPSQVVRAGESVSISLDVRNAGADPQTVQLDVSGVPDGWRATFQGGGRVVRSVWVGADASRSVSLNVELPDDVQDGTYRLTVSGRGQGVQSSLPLELIVGEGLPPQVRLAADLPVLKGSPNTNFNYRLTVKNGSDQDLLVSFEVSAPEGFGVTVKKAFGGQELASLPVKAGQSDSVDVGIKPDSQTAAGEYPISVRALAEQASDQIDLTAIVTGQPNLFLTTSDGRLSGRATAGQQTPLQMVLRNDGTAPATNVRISASPPASWEVTFDPEEIASLEPNQEVPVTANLTPPDKAVAGDYVVTVRAVPEGGSTETAEFRITVVTSTVWGIVGLVLIAAALGVVALAVARFGRR